MTYLYNGVLLTIKTNEILIHAIIWMNLENYAKEQKPVTKDSGLYDFIYLFFVQKRQIYRD